MPKFAYILEYGVIHRYSVQPDGNLSSLGDPVPCTDAVCIAYTNASKFSRGGDYLFIASESESQGDKTGSLSVYHIETDGSLTPNVKNDTNGVDTAPQYIFGFYSGSNTYDIYIDNFYGRDAQNPVSEQIRVFKFNAPSNIKPWNKKVIDVPDTITGDIRTLELVSTPGASPSYQAQFLLAIFQDAQVDKAWIVSFGASAFGLGYLGSKEITSDDADIEYSGYYLAADPNGKFAYVIYDSIRNTIPVPNQITGFKLEGSGRQFTSLGEVAKLTGSGIAGVVSQNGKYLFVAIEAGGNAVISYKIESDGSLTKSDQKPCGALGVATLVIEPGGRYLYAPSEYGGAVYIYEINDEDGTLTPKPPMNLDIAVGSSLTGMVILDV
ncbi:beta-propeller fold lactonase family protein [Pandoraea pulmonicola]|uniref:6-phosphogluconolactonase n=1 Tax=Pandoraea pulmonicola TaxID=93221 RepID=A0AAJ5CYW6_PANPU|nr:beta-propeller fold lactonase family protein [Pandoraea pulmonicola]SUA88970.1 6-phosphogluconolactonase [Pandoraea pulmonicola]